jgi:transposase InsO family protein
LDSLSRGARNALLDRSCLAAVELRDPDSRHDGQPVNHKRVARVMRGIGLAGLRLRRRRRTTIPDPNAAKAPDLIGRDFTAPTPNERYVGDIKCRHRSASIIAALT